jgi:hypothetical protein
MSGSDDGSDIEELRLRITTGSPALSAKLAAKTVPSLARRPRGRPRLVKPADK